MATVCGFTCQFSVVVAEGSSLIGRLIVQINIGDVSQFHWICCSHEGPLDMLYVFIVRGCIFIGFHHWVFRYEIGHQQIII